MSRRIKAAVAVAGPLAGLLAAAACGAGPATATHAAWTGAPVFTPAAHCPFDLGSVPPALLAGRRIRCGQVTVPRLHSRPDTGTLRLAVLDVGAGSGRPTADAVVGVEGGPGDSARLSRVADFARAGRDMIVYDPRGTGSSAPALTCPEVTANPDLFGAATEFRGPLLHCARRLAGQGIPLAAYDVRESAADIDDIRRALGYRAIDLAGLSYGTRVALEAMRASPHTVRTAVLDSVAPPNVDVVNPGSIEHALAATFAACAHDATCHRAFPDPAQTLGHVLAHLDAHPLAVTTTAGTVHVDGARLTRLFFDLQKRPDRIPALIDRMGHGDFSTVIALVQNQAAAGTGWPWALQWSVMCGDGVPATARPATPADAARLPARFDQALDQATAAVARLCAAWPVPVVRPPMVHSRIPALLLAGAFDQMTNPSFADIAARGLPNGRVVRFPDRGHGVIGDDCSRTVVDAFITDPTAAPPTACVAGLHLTFTTG